MAPLTAAERRALTETRRDLHKHPELAYAEARTAGVVEARLRAAGYALETGVAGTGVVARKPGKGPRTLLLRADMDALPVQERNEVDYASVHAGRMHACGHDGHVAALLTAAERLAAAELPGSLVFCFQPAEEGAGGAQRMIEAGVLEGVDAAFGVHLWSSLEVGLVGLASGPVMAAVDRFDLVLRGRGGHGAMPQQATDPVVAACQLVTALQTIVSRETDPLDSCVVTVGQLLAGDNFNVIPSEARLSGTCRSFTREAHAALPERFERVVRGICAALGCEYSLDYLRTSGPTINEPGFTAFVREVAAEVLGPGSARVEGPGVRTMAGEDFSAFLERVPGCFAFVGARNEARGIVHPHHSPRFDIDEEALGVAARLMEGVARGYLAGA
ncbi:MAG: M20 family metallopeptidase [Planctomycetota bacterium]